MADPELTIVDLGVGTRELRVHGEPRALLETGEGIGSADTPKPYIHPLRTPAGVVVTGFAPEDHSWHHGLQFAMPRVDAHNLWGGGTYFSPEEGYRVVEDQGSIVHLGWAEEFEGRSAGISEVIAWRGHGGEPLVNEVRRWAFRSASIEDSDALVIDFATTLRSATGADVALETPAQRGRPDGGYGGLFLRLAEGFHAVALDGDGVDLTESGGESRTMVVHGVTGDDELVTLGLAFGENPRVGHHRWLHRFDPFSAIGWAVAYVDGLVVPVGAELAFQHRLVLADGHLDPVAVRRLL
ncbi:MAG: PmoA family protein [Protaetiibacter sp.]